MTSLGASMIGAALLGHGVPAAAGEPLVLSDERPSAVSAYGGMVAWSAYDGGRGGYSLMVREDDRTRRLAVPVSSSPFDVDLGPGKRGQTVAVYSRCTKTSAAIDPRFESINWTVNRRCRIYEADAHTGREHRLLFTDETGASEYLPAVWRDRVAFARLGRSARRPEIMIMRRDGTIIRRAAGGPVGGFSARTRAADATPGPRSLDLRGSKAVYVWGYSPGPHCAPTISQDPGGVSEVRVLSNSDPAVIARACTASGGAVLGASWDGNSIVYAVNEIGGYGARSATIVSAASPFSSQPSPAGFLPIDAMIVALAVDGDGGFATAVRYVPEEDERLIEVKRVVGSAEPESEDVR